MDQTGGLQGKSVRNVAPYHNTILAVHNNQTPCRLMATGDAEGHSPVEKAVSKDGKIFWDSSSNFRIIDSNYLPPSREDLQGVFSGTGSGRE